MRIVLILLVILSGCGNELIIESDTSWSGSINGSSIEGGGSRSYDMDNSSCATIQKDTERGYLNVKVKGGIFNSILEEKKTTASYGVCSVCSGGF